MPTPADLTLAERLRRLMTAAPIPGALPVEATNQVLDSRPIPTRPTPGSAPQSVATPPESTPMPPLYPPRQITKLVDPPRPTLPERVMEVMPGVLATGLGETFVDGVQQVARRVSSPRQGPTPGSQVQRFSLPAPATGSAPDPFSFLNPELIELIQGIHRGDITLAQAEEFAARSNPQGDFNRGDVSALLRAAEERRAQAAARPPRNIPTTARRN